MIRLLDANNMKVLIKQNQEIFTILNDGQVNNIPKKTIIV